jgi:hypothetical protein
LVDQNNAVVVELYKEQMAVHPLKDIDVVTNHFREIKHGALKYDDYPNSYDRMNYCRSKIESMHSLKDVMNCINPLNEQDAAQIWRTGHFFTQSSSIIRYDNCENQSTLLYTQKNDQQYQSYESTR